MSFAINFVNSEQNNENSTISQVNYEGQPPAWHRDQARLILYKEVPGPSADTFLVAGNAAANMSITGMTLLSAVSGVDDGFGYVPLPFEFRFFGVNYANSGSAPALFWNTNNVLGFGTGFGTPITWLANSGRGILIGNTDRRTNTFYYSGQLTSGSTNYINMVLYAQNIYNDAAPNVIQYQIRMFRSPNNQYVELRINGFGATQGQWNITNGTSFQGTFGAYSASAGTSWVLRSDLNGNTWTFFNNYYINI